MSLLTRVRERGGVERERPDAVPSAVKSEVKRELLERVGFEEAARLASYANVAEARRELRPALEAVLNVSEREEVRSADRDQVMAEVLDDRAALRECLGAVNWPEATG